MTLLLLLLSTSLALNAAWSSILFGRIKRQPKAWWSAAMEEAVSERRRAFAAAHRSDEDCQAYIFASRHASSVIAKAEAWQVTCSSLSPKSNPESVHSPLGSVAGSSHLPLLAFSTVPLPKSRLWSSPITCDPSFLSSSQRLCYAEPGVTFPSSAEPRVLRSLSRPFAPLSPPLNFLRLP